MTAVDNARLAQRPRGTPNCRADRPTPRAILRGTPTRQSSHFHGSFSPLPLYLDRPDAPRCPLAREFCSADRQTSDEVRRQLASHGDGPLGDRGAQESIGVDALIEVLDVTARAEEQQHRSAWA